MDLKVDEGPLFDALARIEARIAESVTDAESARQMLLDVREMANKGLMDRQANYNAALDAYAKSQA